MGDFLSQVFKFWGIVLLVLVGGFMLFSVPVDDLGMSDSASVQNAKEESGFSDNIGYESGYWHDSSISVNPVDGFNETEMNAYFARSMARVEYLRKAEFKQSVDIRVVNREEHQNENPFKTDSAKYSRWNGQVWQALFISSNEKNISDEFTEIFGTSVLGYYVKGENEIVIVSDSIDGDAIDTYTVIHELTHALQDQRFDLRDDKYNPSTQDRQLAVLGLIEGEAKYIENRYKERCLSGEWECIEQRSKSDGSGRNSGNIGLKLTMYQPYSDGPQYIRNILNNSGWSGVDKAFRNPPNKSSNIISPDTELKKGTLSEIPAPREGWNVYKDIGYKGTDSVGEASIFMMMWYQNRGFQIDTIPISSIISYDGSAYNYKHPISSGYVSDKITPYKKSNSDGYVWQIKFKSEYESEAFKQAYEKILRGHNATYNSNMEYEIVEPGFEGVYLVTKNSSQITIVHGPNSTSVSNIYPD